MNMINRLIFMISLFLLMMLCNSCAPVFSDLQSARTVGDGNLELSGHYSSYSFSGDNGSGSTNDNFGVQLVYGLSSKVDLAARYERLNFEQGDGDDSGLNIVGIGPKISMVKNKFALFFPFGRALGEDSEDSWQLQPTAVVTFPAVANKIDINISPKYIFQFCDDCDSFVALNIGGHFSNDLSDWSIRAEYGQLYNPGEDGHFSQFSVGFAKRFVSSSSSE